MMKMRAHPLGLVTIIFAAACSDAADPIDASVDASVGIDTGVQRDVGFADSGAQDSNVPDGGVQDTGPGADGGQDDAAALDTGPIATFRISGDVLVRPSRFGVGGSWLAYWESYSEQPNQLATNGQLHLYEIATATDHQVASNVSPLGVQFNDDWSRVLYCQRIDTTDFTAPTFAYDRAAGTSLQLGDAAFFRGLFASDGSAAVVMESYDRNTSAGEVLRWDWPAATSASLTASGALVFEHDLPRWFLYLDPAVDELHVAQLGGDTSVADQVVENSIQVSENRSAFVYVRAVGGSGGALERVDFPGAVSSTIAAGVRPNLVSISADGARVVYGTGAATDISTDLFLASVGSPPASIATGVIAQSVAIAPSHQVVAYFVSTGAGVGDLHVWSVAAGDRLVASGVSTLERVRVADDGSSVAFFSTWDSGTGTGELSLWRSGTIDVLGTGVSSTGILRTPNLERVAFAQNANATRGDLVLFTGTLPTIPIATGVSIALALDGGSAGYFANPTLDRMIAYVPGATPAIGELHGWRDGGTAGRIAQGVPAGSWRVTPDRTTLVFLADFVNEATGPDHGTLQVSTESAPAPATIHGSVGRNFTLSDDRVAFVAVLGSVLEENGLFLAPLP